MLHDLFGEQKGCSSQQSFKLEYISTATLLARSDLNFGNKFALSNILIFAGYLQLLM